MGAVFGFVLWCVYEAVVLYRWEREMNKFEAKYPLNWMWRLDRRIMPLFHEQRRKDEVFGEDV